MAFNADAATRDENDHLYPRVFAGDEPAIERMIMGNTALVIAKVDDYLREFPAFEHFRDDLKSAGYVAVVEAVRSMVGAYVENPNATGFISQKIYFALGQLIDSEQGIRVPGQTYRKKKAAGKEIRVPLRDGTLEVEHTLQKEGTADPRSMVDLRDELDGCCESDVDRDIIRLREEGLSDADIAERLGIPKTTTYMLRRAIYARFLERNPELRGEA